MKFNYSIFEKIIKQVCPGLVAEYKFHPTRKWRFDYAIPELKIAIEIEGGVWSAGRHVRGTGFKNDIEKYNTATVMGWRVLRFASDDILKTNTIDTITKVINADS